MELFRRLLVGLLGLIDGVVYYLIEIIYGLLMDIAGARPFSDDIFALFAKRVYVLLGLFMLFKISFSLIKYIVNPDEFNDKVKGGKKLVINILVVLILIVVNPMAFDVMRDVQKTLLEEQVLEKIILGSGVNNEPIEPGAMGNKVKVAVFSSFYRPDDEKCGNSNPGDTEQFVEDCTSYMGENLARGYSMAYKAGSVNDMIHKEVDGEPIFMSKNRNGDGYAINYLFIVSTIAGLFTAWIFLTFCIDIAIRTVKLGFLQLISPIPIISYVDPASSKNGMFNKWLKDVGKTYGDLFVRLAAVYFAITLIAALMQNTDLGTTNFLARVFIILGILIFANQVPKLIGDLLGIKIDGNFSLNPMRKINSSPIAAAVVGGATGLAAGMVANSAAAMQPKLKEIKENGGFTGGEGLRTAAGWKNLGKNVLGMGSLTGTTLAGGASAMLRGGKAASTGKGSAFGAGFKGASAASRARNARDGGYNIRDKFHDKFTDMAGIKSETGTTSEIGDKIKVNQQQIENYKQEELAYRQQLSLMRQNNPRGYLEAFKKTVRTDPTTGQVLVDKEGKRIVDKEYDSYESYFSQFTSDISQTQMEERMAHIMEERHYADDEAGRARALQEARDEIATERGLITERQYADYDAIEKAEAEADSAAHKLEKRNKELQGYLDAKSGKPKE